MQKPALIQPGIDYLPESEGTINYRKLREIAVSRQANEMNLLQNVVERTWHLRVCTTSKETGEETKTISIAASEGRNEIAGSLAISLQRILSQEVS